MTIFVGAHVVNDFYSTVLPAFLPAVADQFDLDYTELGILSFAFAIFGGVLQPLLGNVADRRGKRLWMLVFGFSIGSVGFLAMAIAPSFWVIVIVSSLCGLGGATYHPQAAAFIVAAYPERRGQMLGVHGWGGSAGHFLAPAVAVLGIAVIGWRFSMAVIAIPMVVTAIVLRAKLEETEPSHSVTLTSVVSRGLILVAVMFGLMSVVGRSFLTFFVKMLVDEGWQETRAGVLLTVILLSGAVAQPLGGWAFDRVGGRKVFLVASSATVVLTGLFALSSGALSLVAIAGITFFQFTLFPVALAQASSLVASSQTGTATGIVFGVSGLMTAAAQPAVGALGESLGDIRLALAWLLPLGLVAAVLAYKAQDSLAPSTSDSDTS